MNFRILFVILMNILLLSCDDDDYPYADVPSVVLNEFWAQYPDATDADFKKFGEDYEVEFEVDGNDHSAVYNTSGIILKKKKEIEWNALPLEVQKRLQENYGQKKVEDFEWVKLGEDIFYQAEVNKFFMDEKIVLNAAGKVDTSQNFWK